MFVLPSVGFEVFGRNMLLGMLGVFSIWVAALLDLLAALAVLFNAFRK